MTKHPTWNPCGLPLDRPFLLHLDMNSVTTGMVAYIIFPHEYSSTLKHQGAILELNNKYVIASTTDERIKGFSEIPEALHETLIWRQPERYASHPIGKKLEEHYTIKHMKWAEASIERYIKKGKLTEAERLRHQKETYRFFDPLFDNGVYIGPVG